jgi:hypothetical protein
MAYDKNKLAEAKLRYRTAIEEARMGLIILEALEQAGGEMLGLDMVTVLLSRRALKANKTEREWCQILEIDPDEIMKLSDELLEFGLEEVL